MRRACLGVVALLLSPALAFAQYATPNSGQVNLGASVDPLGAAKNSRIDTAPGVNATLVKSTPGRMYGWVLANTSNATRFVRLFDLNRAPVAGSDVPMITIPVPAGGTPIVFSTLIGSAFVNGLAYDVTAEKGDADASPVQQDDVLGTILYY